MTQLYLIIYNYINNGFRYCKDFEASRTVFLIFLPKCFICFKPLPRVLGRALEIALP